MASEVAAQFVGAGVVDAPYSEIVLAKIVFVVKEEFFERCLGHVCEFYLGFL